MTHADARPRIYINANRDKRSATWTRHPDARGEFAVSPGAALDAALEQIGDEGAVIIWSGRS